jgi:hypothetical protein
LKSYQAKRVERVQRKFKRMRDGRQQPETLIARVKDDLTLPHRRNALGRVEWWSLPGYISDEEQAAETFQGAVRQPGTVARRNVTEYAAVAA